MNTTQTKTNSLSIKTAGNRARSYLGAKASPSEVGKLAARLIALSRSSDSPLAQAAAELKLLESMGR